MASSVNKVILVGNVGVQIAGVHLDNGGVTIAITAEKVKSIKIERKEECLA